MSDFDGPAMRRFLELFADRLHERRDELTQLDSAIGDADHGINMDRGFSAARAKLDEIDNAELGGFAKGVGMTLISTVGGASGPLYGTFFLRLATTFGDAATATPDELGAALRAGLDGVRQRGKAELDDKTMVDAMSPAVDAYEAASGDGIGAALTAAATAAAATAGVLSACGSAGGTPEAVKKVRSVPYTVRFMALGTNPWMLEQLERFNKEVGPGLRAFSSDRRMR